MLVSFIKKGIYGYLREDRIGLYGFVSNNNLSIRREALEATGGYDDSLRIAEDYDLCQRATRDGWLIYYSDEVSLAHRARKTFGALLRQWWNYGYYLAAGYKNHFPHRWVVQWRRPRWDDPDSPEPVRFNRARPPLLTRLTGLSLFVDVNAFSTAHLAAAAAGAGWAAGASWLALPAAAVALVSALVYCLPDAARVLRDGPRRSLALCTIRYGVNAAFVLGGLLGGLRRGALYLFPIIDTPM